jgi:hypothetical protein
LRDYNVKIAVAVAATLALKRHDPSFDFERHGFNSDQTPSVWQTLGARPRAKPVNGLCYFGRVNVANRGIGQGLNFPSFCAAMAAALTVRLNGKKQNQGEEGCS